MAIHPLAESFVEVAAAYERGRPEYPLAVVGALAAELHLSPGATVLDLAAGTGKLSRSLLDLGLDVVAVEPLAQLREILVQRLGDKRVRDGVAEDIPLAEHSVAAVTVAEAFHWFDHAAALAEIARVLTPGGGLAVLSTLPDWSGASWAHEVGTLMASLRPSEHPNFDGPRWHEAARAAGYWSEPSEIRLTMMHPTQPEALLAYMESVSWVAALPQARRGDIIGQIEAIIGAGETPAELPIHFVIGITTLR